MSTITKAKAAERDEAIAQLRAMFPAGSTVPTVLRHVSASGMSRAVTVLGPGSENVSWLVARATGGRLHRSWDAVVMGGCGMDMGFALVYDLARVLYRDGFACVGDRCPSNDHSNERGSARDYTPGRLHSNPGYALRHRWV